MAARQHVCRPSFAFLQPFAFSNVKKESTRSELRDLEGLRALECAGGSQHFCIIVKSPHDLQADGQSVFHKAAR